MLWFKSIMNRIYDPKTSLIPQKAGGNHNTLLKITLRCEIKAQIYII